MQARSDGANIHYSIRGSGPDLVLLHPFPADHRFWEPLLPALDRHRVLALDLRGMGQSELGDPQPVTMERHAADVLRVLNDTGVSAAIFAGVSIGGYVLFELWRQAPERIRALVLANTKASADTTEAKAAREKAAQDVLQRGPAQFLDALVPRLIGETTRRNRPDILAAARAMMEGVPAESIAALQRGMAARKDSTPDLHRVKLPVLLVASDEDVMLPAAEIQAMHQGITNSRLQMIQQAGHFALWERPEQGKKILRDFLDAIPS